MAKGIRLILSDDAIARLDRIVKYRNEHWAPPHPWTRKWVAETCLLNGLTSVTEDMEEEIAMREAGQCPSE